MSIPYWKVAYYFRSYYYDTSNSLCSYCGDVRYVRVENIEDTIKTIIRKEHINDINEVIKTHVLKLEKNDDDFREIVFLSADYVTDHKKFENNEMFFEHPVVKKLTNDFMIWHNKVQQEQAEKREKEKQERDLRELERLKKIYE